MLVRLYCLFKRIYSVDPITPVQAFGQHAYGTSRFPVDSQQTPARNSQEHIDAQILETTLASLCRSVLGRIRQPAGERTSSDCSATRISATRAANASYGSAMVMTPVFPGLAFTSSRKARPSKVSAVLRRRAITRCSILYLAQRRLRHSLAERVVASRRAWRTHPLAPR